MFKRVGLILLMAALMGAVFPTFAQDATPEVGAQWSVSLYNQPAATVTRVLPTGEVAYKVTLPIGEGFDSYGYNVVTSPAKNLIAYLVSQVGDGSNRVQPTQLIVFDADGHSLRVSYNLDANATIEGVNAAGTALHFNADGTRLITGYYVPTGEENKYTMILAALDTTTGQVTNMLDSQALASAGVNPGTAYYTQVIAFDGDTAVVVLRPVFVIENAQPVALNWNVVTNEATAAPIELVDATDYFSASGEALLVNYGGRAVDTPAPQETPVPQTLPSHDTIQLFDVNLFQVRTVYHEEANLISAKFVQNGERILIFADSGARGILIDSDGNVLKEFPSLPGDTFTFGIPEGFIYSDPNQPGSLVMVKTDDESFTSTPFYTSPDPFTSLSIENYGGEE